MTGSLQTETPMSQLPELAETLQKDTVSESCKEEMASSTLSALYEHAWMHYGRRRYLCNVCDFSADVQESVVQHLLAHQDTAGVNPKIAKKTTSPTPPRFNQFRVADIMAAGSHGASGADPGNTENSENMDPVAADENMPNDAPNPEAEPPKKEEQRFCGIFGGSRKRKSSTHGSDAKNKAALNKCMECGVTLRGHKCRHISLIRLIDHVRGHLDARGFECNVCGFRHKHGGGIGNHLRTVHNSSGMNFQDKSTPEEQDVLRAALCKNFPLQFEELKEWIVPPPSQGSKHWKRKSVASPDATEDPAEQPTQIRASTKQNDGGTAERNKCTVCGVQLTDAGAPSVRAQKLWGHVRHHFDFKPYGCTVCGVRTKRKESTRLHMRKWHPESEPVVDSTITDAQKEELHEFARRAFPSQIQELETFYDDDAPAGKRRRMDQTAHTSLENARLDEGQPEAEEIAKESEDDSGTEGLETEYTPKATKGSTRKRGKSVPASGLTCKDCGVKVSQTGADWRSVWKHIREHFDYEPYVCCECGYRSSTRVLMYYHHNKFNHPVVDYKGTKDQHDKLIAFAQRAFPAKFDVLKTVLEAEIARFAATAPATSEQPSNNHKTPSGEKNRGGKPAARIHDTRGESAKNASKKKRATIDFSTPSISTVFKKTIVVKEEPRSEPRKIVRPDSARVVKTEPNDDGGSRRGTVKDTRMTELQQAAELQRLRKVLEEKDTELATLRVAMTDPKLVKLRRELELREVELGELKEKQEKVYSQLGRITSENSLLSDEVEALKNRR
ncbi:unnamed protein product, partial [Mesorhabditis spiculigera]